MKKKVFLMLSCIAAVAIISGYGGMKVYQLHAKDCGNMLLQDVEALAANGEDDGETKYLHMHIYTTPIGEEYHLIITSGKDAQLCRDIIDITWEYCEDPDNEEGLFTCSHFNKKNRKHNPIGTL